MDSHGRDSSDMGIPVGLWQITKEKVSGNFGYSLGKRGVHRTPFPEVFILVALTVLVRMCWAVLP